MLLNPRNLGRLRLLVENCEAMICSWLLRTSWKKRDKNGIDSFLCCVERRAELLKGMKRGFHNLSHSVNLTICSGLWTELQVSPSSRLQLLLVEQHGCAEIVLAPAPSARATTRCYTKRTTDLPKPRKTSPWIARTQRVIKLGCSCVLCLATLELRSFMATAPSAPSFTDLWPLWIEAESPVLKMAQHWV